MKRSCTAILFVMLLCSQVSAYVTDDVLVAKAPGSGTSKDAALMAKEMMITIEDALLKAFSCLNVTTQGELVSQIDDLRTAAKLGPGGWQWYNNASVDNPDQFTTDEEEKAFQQKVDNQLAQLAKVAGAKYVVSVEAVSDKNMSSIAVLAINMKNAQTYYRDAQIFKTPVAAIAGAKGLAEKLVKGFADYLSGQKGGTGEICPFTGRVDLYREETIEREEKSIRPTYCNGADEMDMTIDSFNSMVREVWSLERFGNPDTRGKLEAEISKKSSHEELEHCYACPTGETGRRELNSSITATGSIRGLSDKSVAESTNKDATVKLEFKKDGTYYVIVKASSVTGEKQETVTEKDHGPCTNHSTSDPPKILPLTLYFDYRFGPFTGTPLDDKLSGQKEVKLQNEDTKAATILRIDFELEGFKRK